MSRYGRRAGASLLAAAAAVCVSSAPAAASGSGAHFTDPSAHGYIALCDLAGHNVTGGSVNSTPLVWKAVSSVAAPRAFQGKGENAALFIYQVRQDTPPADWSGDTLSADSLYRNRHHPAAEMTYRDLSLADIVKEFPPLFDGLYQLRMHVGKINYATYSATYPATVIKVTGSTWHVVQGGSAACGTSTSTKSSEVYAGQELVSPTPDKNQTAVTAPPSVRLVGATVAGQPAAYTATTSGSVGAAGSSHSAALITGGVALVVVAAVGGGWIYAPKRRAGRTGSSSPREDRSRA